jgi:acylphosphatase
MTRMRVRYEGRVQGVGFRATVVDVARDFQVTGRVANVSDGSVELIAEGEDGELLRFREGIQARLDRYIRRAIDDWEVADSGWTDFRVAPDKWA